MIKPSERKHLLHLLAGDEVAWEMIATWPNMNLDGLPDQEEEREQELCSRWAMLCGRLPLEVRRIIPKLLDNGFVRMDGTVDPFADRYVEAMMVAKLPRGVRPGSRQPDAHEKRTGAP